MKRRYNLEMWNTQPASWKTTKMTRLAMHSVNDQHTLLIILFPIFIAMRPFGKRLNATQL